MNTSSAHKLSASEVVKEFQQAHNNLDLLRVFLITGTSDISRTYEFITKLHKNTSNQADKAKYTKALRILENIELRRIELTSVIYNVGDVNLPDITESTVIVEEVKDNTIVMLPSLDDILLRVKTMLTSGGDVVETNKGAFELLKSTVGQGKATDAEGKSVSWDNEKINEFIYLINNEPTEATTTETKVEAESIFFKVAYDQVLAMIEEGKQATEIKDFLKSFLIGKVIKGSAPENDYFIKDEAIFEDYYTRMVENVVIYGITSYNKKNELATEGTSSKTEQIEKEITEVATTMIQDLEKDTTQKSLSPVARVIRDTYKKLGLSMNLRDAYFKARELAEKISPNFFNKTKESEKDSIQTAPPTEKVEEKAVVEIYDDSHNIKESNKELWAEVEKYEYLNQLFTKAVELSKKGFWKDALSMSTILISSGQIKETESSEETLKWDIDQIKLWFNNIVENAAKTSEETKVEEKIEQTEATAVQGPVPQINSIDSKAPATRLLKDSSLWKETYSFKSFPIKVSRRHGGSMSFEIVDATKEQEKDLLIIEENMTAFLDDLRNQLVVRRNDQPKVKETLSSRLSAFYEITNTEVRAIIENLLEEADALRRAAKNEAKKGHFANNKTSETPTTPKVEVPTVETPVVEVPKVETPVIEEKSEEAVQSPPAETAPVEETKENESQTQSTESSENEASENTTEENAGNEPGNSNEDSYEGFEDIIKAKDKLGFHKAVFSKINEYKSSEEGIKAVFDVVNTARKNSRYKKSFVRNYKPANDVDLLSMINKVYTTGVEQNKNK